MLNKASESFDKPDRAVQAFHGLTGFWVPERIRTEECELKTLAVYSKANFLCSFFTRLCNRSMAIMKCSDIGKAV